MGIAEDIIIILIFGLIFGFIAHKLKTPPILGYIVAGILIGPYTGGATISDVKQIELLAEIGVALLLFSIGLELSFKEIKEVRKIAIIGGSIQIILCIVYGYAVGRYMGLPYTSSFVLGTIFSLSSTMVVMKTLMNRGLTGTLSSRVMIGILIIQDLAAIPMMVLIPKLGNLEEGLGELGITLLTGILFILLTVILGTRIIPLILKTVSRQNSRELFLLTITVIGLGIGFLTHVAGLSLAFGAFVAGMVLNESEFSHKALDDIIPLRDIFGLIFFTSIGMLFDPRFVLDHYRIILVLALLVIAGKALIFSTISRIFGYVNIIPIAVGLGLSQIGEFSFVLARVGLNEKILSNDVYSTVLATTVITMFMTPLLSMLTSPLYSLKRKWIKSDTRTNFNIPDDGLDGHVIIAGGGRVGCYVAGTLHSLEQKSVLIEENYNAFEKSRNAGYPVIYADAGNQEVLIDAGLKESRLLIITIPSFSKAEEIISHANQINPGINIIVRSGGLDQFQELHKLNIYEIVQPEFEASLEITRQALIHLGMPSSAIQNYLDSTRAGSYIPNTDKPLHEMSDMRNMCHFLEMTWLQISPESNALKKSIGDLAIRKKTGISVIGVYRNKAFIPNPEPDFIFENHDMIAIIGNKESKEKFESLMGIKI